MEDMDVNQTTKAPERIELPGGYYLAYYGDLKNYMALYQPDGTVFPPFMPNRQGQAFADLMHTVAMQPARPAVPVRTAEVAAVRAQTLVEAALAIHRIQRDRGNADNTAAFVWCIEEMQRLAATEKGDV